MKKGDLLTEFEVRRRLNKAVDDICSDLSDMVKLHNQLCKGEVELIDAVVEELLDFRCVEGDE